MSIMKSILVAGLGKHASASDITTVGTTSITTSGIREKVQASIAVSRAAGYDVQDTQVNPADPTTSLAELSTLLQSRQWDGFMIGYGLRGNKDYTPVFEQVVELVREKAPGAKLLFSNAPDEIFLTIERTFGKEMKEGRVVR